MSIFSLRGIKASFFFFFASSRTSNNHVDISIGKPEYLDLLLISSHHSKRSSRPWDRIWMQSPCFVSWLQKTPAEEKGSEMGKETSQFRMYCQWTGVSTGSWGLIVQGTADRERIEQASGKKKKENNNLPCVLSHLTGKELGCLFFKSLPSLVGRLPPERGINSWILLSFPCKGLEKAYWRRVPDAYQKDANGMHWSSEQRRYGWGTNVFATASKAEGLVCTP